MAGNDGKNRGFFGRHFGKKNETVFDRNVDFDLGSERMTSKERVAKKLTDRIYYSISESRLAKFFTAERKRKSNLMRAVGLILFIISMFMLIPILIGLPFNENLIPFIVPMVLGLVISIIILRLYSSSHIYRSVDGTIIILAIWGLVSVFGMLPYLLSGWALIDALFESVSGFTTVGATVIGPYYGTSTNALMAWRVTTQWIGGIMIILLFMVIIPMFVSGGRGLSKSEMDATATGGLHLKVGAIAFRFITVYIILTIIGYFAIAAATLGNWSAAFYISLSTVSIGGFINPAGRLELMDNPVVKVIVIALIFVSVTNFYLHFKAIVKRERGTYRKDSEFKAMTVWFIIVAALAVIAALYVNLTEGKNYDLLDAAFMSISMSSTLGLESVDSFWGGGLPVFAVLFIVMGMFIGGSSGSPSGGVKVGRMLIIMKSLSIEVYKFFNPSVVYYPKISGKPIDEDRTRNAYAVFVLFILSIIIVTMVFSVFWADDGEGIEKSFFTAISIMSATGTAPMDFATLNPLLKIFVCIMMIFARMEIVAILAIFMPRFWSDVFKKNTDISNPMEKSFIEKIQFRRNRDGPS